MSILLIAEKRDLNKLRKSIQQLDENTEVEVWPVVRNKDRVKMVVCWNHPKHLLGQFPNLQVASSLGAGVNHLLNDKDISSDVQICRVVTPDLKEMISEFTLLAVISYRRKFVRYIEQKKEAHWSPTSSVDWDDSVIGIMGLGEMGKTIASSFGKLGYQVNGWSRSKKDIKGVTSFSGTDGLTAFLNKTNILICCLPLTDETRGILDLDLFKKLRKPAYLINIGRGAHLVEEDLVYALDTKQLDGAFLDVFTEEPLPANHIFWNRPNITITPHVAAVTGEKQAAKLILENYKRMLSGMPLLYEVDRVKGY